MLIHQTWSLLDIDDWLSVKTTTKQRDWVVNTDYNYIYANGSKKWQKYIWDAKYEITYTDSSGKIYEEKEVNYYFKERLLVNWKKLSIKKTNYTPKYTYDSKELTCPNCDVSRIARFMKDNSWARVVILWYTNIGDDLMSRYRLEDSKEHPVHDIVKQKSWDQAQIIKNALIKQWIDGNRITIDWKWLSTNGRIYAEIIVQ